MPPSTALLFAVLAACTPRAVTPPSRTFALDTPLAPAAPGGDVQLDASRSGAVWGPELVTGGARYRQNVDDRQVVEADAAILHVTNSGHGARRNAYTGRVGTLLRSSGGGAALALGIGGGYAPAGGIWAAADLGGWLSGQGRLFRPIMGGHLGYSRPLGDRTFVVHEPDEEMTPTTLRLPNNAYLQSTLGLELGPREGCVVVGASVVYFRKGEPSVVDGPEREAEEDRDDVFFSLGLGVRAAL